MADYIHKNILAEAYVHIEPVTLTGDQKEQFEQSLLSFAETRGKFSIYEDIVPEVRTRDGSLKVYTTVTGTLTEALGDFTNFDEALDALYTDAKRLAEAMILESLFMSRARGKAVLRKEARTGIVRSTKELFDEISLAHARFEEDVPRAAIKRLTDIAMHAEKLFSVLASNDDIRLIKKQAKARVKILPIPLKVQAIRVAGEESRYDTARNYLMSIL